MKAWIRCGVVALIGWIGWGVEDRLLLAEDSPDHPNGPGIEWVAIPDGSYRMGSEADERSRPVHPVTVQCLEMGRTEVTIGQYGQCTAAGRCTPPATGEGCTWQRGASTYPVNCVTWQQAQEFFAWMNDGSRLCTEAEWEYAARSLGQQLDYPWGNAPASCKLAIMWQRLESRPDVENAPGCGQQQPWPVCSRRTGHSTQQVCDLAGNVAEWVADHWHAEYVEAPKMAVAWVDEGGQERVIRGGSYREVASALRTTHRDAFLQTEADSTIGFRACRTRKDATCQAGQEAVQPALSNPLIPPAQPDRMTDPAPTPEQGLAARAEQEPSTTVPPSALAEEVARRELESRIAGRTASYDELTGYLASCQGQECPAVSTALAAMVKIAATEADLAKLQVAAGYYTTLQQTKDPVYGKLQKTIKSLVAKREKAEREEAARQRRELEKARKEEALQRKQAEQAIMRETSLSRLETIYRTNDAGLGDLALRRARAMRANEFRIVRAASSMFDNSRMSQYKIHICRYDAGVVYYEMEMTFAGAFSFFSNPEAHFDGYSGSGQQITHLLKKIPGVRSAEQVLGSCRKPWYY